MVSKRQMRKWLEGALRMAVLCATAAGAEPSGDLSPLGGGGQRVAWGDTVPPAAPVVTSPTQGQVVGTTTPTFSGTAEPHSIIQLFVDESYIGDTEAQDSGSWSFTVLSDLAQGERMWMAIATDEAGNDSAPSTLMAFTIDTLPPDTTLLSGPPEQTSQTSATFDLDSNEAGVTYECSLDGAAFASCTDPVTFTGLASGAHSLGVRARDVAGNVDDTPASSSWNVDTTPPDTTLTSAPPETTRDTTAAFSFTATEASATYECSLDETAFSPCTSPMGYAHMAVGMHTFQVRAADALGNVDPTPATHTWEVQPEDGGGCDCSEAGSGPALTLLGVLLALTTRGARRRRGWAS